LIYFAVLVLGNLFGSHSIRGFAISDGKDVKLVIMEASLDKSSLSLPIMEG
jgi:hypothetical protein